VLNLGTIVPILPKTESQARPLTSLEPEEQIEAWKRVITSTPEGKITAAIVLKAAKEVEAKKRQSVFTGNQYTSGVVEIIPQEQKGSGLRCRFWSASGKH